ncbi:pyruvate ferredoxin oxidoreductase [Patescibacteria group bacterium]
MNTKLENKALTGGAAAAEALRQINPDVMAAYPITPQTPIIETFAKFEADRKVDTEIIPVESEHSAMSACVGSSAAGARTVTATSSQGLALMNEVLYIASGTRLPILMLVSSRALGAPINIHNDHGDVMDARDSGWIQLFSENVQEVYDNTTIGLRLAEKASTPVMVIMDGFITSHSVENLETLPDNDVKNFVGEFHPDKALLNIEDPVTFGPVGLPDSYMDFKIDQEKAMQKSGEYFKNIAGEFGSLSGRNYDEVEEYKTSDAEHIIVILGSTAGTAKDVVDKLREKGRKAGLLKIKLFRPFPYEKVSEVLSKGRSVAVMDKTVSFGAYPPLFTEIITACRLSPISNYVYSYIYGLGGRDIFAKDIENVFDDLLKGDTRKEVKYISK